MTDVMQRDACRNCRRPIALLAQIGWVHDELPQYAAGPFTCDNAHPVSCTNHRTGQCPNGWNP